MRHLISVLLALSIVGVAAVPVAAYSPEGFANAFVRFLNGVEPDIKLINRGVKRDKPALVMRGLRRFAADHVVMARWLRSRAPNECQARPSEFAADAAMLVAKHSRMEANAIQRRAWGAAIRHSTLAEQASKRFLKNAERIIRCGMPA